MGMYHPAPEWWRLAPLRRLLWALEGALSEIRRRRAKEPTLRRRYEARALRLLRELLPESALRRYWRRVAKQTEQDAAEADRFAEVLVAAGAAALLALLRAVRRAALEATLAARGGRLAPAAAEAALAAGAEHLAEVPATLRERLAAILLAAATEAPDEAAFVAAVQRAWREETAHRASLLVNTEWAWAAGATALALLRGARVRRKAWITAGDRRVCAICRANAGVGPIPIERTFPGGVETPPQHPACRCTVSGL